MILLPEKHEKFTTRFCLVSKWIFRVIVWQVKPKHDKITIDITFSINCVLESMRKSLKTVCRQLSVALVSRIRLSNCFSISCVFDSILWEKSWRNRKSCEEKKTVMETATVSQLLSSHQSRTNFKVPSSTLISKVFLQRSSVYVREDDHQLLFSCPISKLGKMFLTYPGISCQRPICTALSHFFKSPGSLPNMSFFLQEFTPAWAICHTLQQPAHL